MVGMCVYYFSLGFISSSTSPSFHASNLLLALILFRMHILYFMRSKET